MNTIRPQFEQAMEEAVRDRVMAQVIATRGDLANRAAIAVPPPLASRRSEDADNGLARSRPLVGPLGDCLMGAIRATPGDVVVPHDGLLTAALEICRSEIEALGRSLFFEQAEPTLEKSREMAFEFARRLGGEILAR